MTPINLPTLTALQVLRTEQEVLDMRRAADAARRQAMRNMVCSPSALDGLRQVHMVYGVSIADPRFAVRLATSEDFRQAVDRAVLPERIEKPAARLSSRHGVISRDGFGGGCRARA